MNKLSMVSIVVTAVLLAGCGLIYNDPGECRDPRTISVEAGTYKLAPDRSLHTSPDFPASQDPGAIIEINREEGKVTVRYDHDGNNVVETYAITDSQYGY